MRGETLRWPTMGMEYLVAAYTVIWVVLGFYIIRIFLRQGKLLAELEYLRKEYKEIDLKGPSDPSEDQLSVITRAEKLRSLTWLLFSLEGRIPRSTFWLYILVVGFVQLLVGFVVGFIINLLPPSGGILIVGFSAYFALILVLTGFPWLALNVKRCHDTDLSGGFVLMNLIPVLGPIIYLVAIGFLPGTKGENRYGPDPIRQVVQRSHQNS